MKKLYICMYHYIRDLRHGRYPDIKGLDSELFEQQLKFFSENFTVIKMEELISAINNGSDLPDNALLLTFDDGFSDHYLTAFPLLVKYGFQGSFFVPARVIVEKSLLDVHKVHFILASAPTDELLSELKNMLEDNIKQYNIPEVEELWNLYAKGNKFDDARVIFIKRILQTAVPEELRAMMCSQLFEKYIGVKEECFAGELYINADQMSVMKRDGMYFGLHGYNHYWMGQVPLRDSCNDIDRALDVMSEYIDPSCWVMNYPYGNTNDDFIDYISGKGCNIGLTTVFRTAQIGSDNRFRLPRFDCNDFPPKSENYKK